MDVNNMLKENNFNKQLISEMPLQVNFDKGSTIEEKLILSCYNCF